MMDERRNIGREGGGGGGNEEGKRERERYKILTFSGSVSVRRRSVEG